MSDELIVALSQVSIPQENLVYESAEERATFGLFSVVANNHLLTEGAEVDKQELRHGPYVSGYPIAEWLAWNWWRLRWEIGHPFDENAACRWNFAHRMSTIGEGYAWPNITIFSDGVHSSLFSAPSRSPETSLFRYIGASGQTVLAVSLETAIDGFVEDILTRLEKTGIRESNLHRLWNELKMERADPELTRFRRLEAQLGYDPDEAEEAAIRLRLDDAVRLGEEALGEIAADATLGDNALSNMMTARDFENIAQRNGFEADPNDAITLSDRADLPQPGQVEAWRLGKRIAQGIRAQKNLDGQPISDSTLAGFAGSMSDTISRQSGHSYKMSFALDNDRCTYMSLRSSQKTGRRFDLARLIGDRVLYKQMNGLAEPLLPATRASSYRQKVQRAFAAELLSPFTFVDDMMGGDYSNEERQNKVAEHFSVSPMTIQTQLLNHRRIDRDDAPDIADHSHFN